MKPDRLACVADWQLAAAAYLPRFVYEYLEKGAEEGRTHRANVESFAQVGWRPLTMVDVERVDTSVDIFGQRLAMPAAVGPTGLNGLLRYKADEHLAAAAGAAGLPFVLSTASTSAIEDVRDATTGPIWLQLYVQHDRSIAQRWMHIAAEHGVSALLLTIDTPVAGVRDHYQRNGLTLPLHWTPRLLWDVSTHLRWLWSTGRHGLPQMVNLAATAHQQADLDAQSALLNQQMSRTLTWQDLSWIRRCWKGPVLVKGIASVSDALLAKQHGVDGLVVSNHGGRQLEDAPVPIHLLPAIRDAVGREIRILIDGGIRRGSAIAKAVALGADAVLLGRAPLYGVAVNGRAGAQAVLTQLRHELEVTLRLTGRPQIRTLDRSAVSTAPMPE